MSEIILKGIIDEDFVNYRVPSMTLMFPKCSFKCEKEYGENKVDFYDKYIRIIDYKTGSVSASLTELYYGKKLQLFLYGKVCASIFNKEFVCTILSFVVSLSTVA